MAVILIPKSAFQTLRHDVVMVGMGQRIMITVREEKTWLLYFVLKM